MPIHIMALVFADSGYAGDRVGQASPHVKVEVVKRDPEQKGFAVQRRRWVVERTFAWLNQFRRLRVRYERRADMHLAFLTVGCILICWKFLEAESP